MIEVSVIAGLICAGVVFFSDTFARLSAEPCSQEQPELPAIEADILDLNLIQDLPSSKSLASLSAPTLLDEIRGCGQKPLHRAGRSASVPSFLAGA